MAGALGYGRVQNHRFVSTTDQVLVWPMSAGRIVPLDCLIRSAVHNPMGPQRPSIRYSPEYCCRLPGLAVLLYFYTEIPISIVILINRTGNGYKILRLHNYMFLSSNG